MDNHNSTSDGDDELQHLVVKVVDGEEEEQRPKLRVSGLSRVLEPSGLSILSEVTVEILAGSIVGIIGPSGSGKSTFLRALNRMWDPPKHTVFLDDQDIHNLDVLSLRRKIGMLFQVPALFPASSLQLMEARSDEILQHLLVDIVDDDRNGEENKKPKLQIRELSKVLDTTGVQILFDVCVDIPKGLIVGIIGPSGSGKSTVLRSLNRLWDPPKNTVFLDNQDILDLDVLSLRRKVGMLFQSPVLFQGKLPAPVFDFLFFHKPGVGLFYAILMTDRYSVTVEMLIVWIDVSYWAGTVGDNIRYGPKLTGKKLSDDEVTKLLALADLDSSFASKNGNELSVGQAQRVALARTLANDPEVLLLDEPTSALDPISTQAIEDTILKLKKTHKLTTVIVSHSVRQIQRIVDVIYLLVEGKIVEVLRPDRLSEASHPMARKFLELS
ncbi:hypothetical protein C5167_034341 [Papaver somniferum]|uniref:ABC transporter domain-containing protein n=1 Tax=Papaver somniferum TaxID=3469 RepID=A0A4Y7KE70_PAPSO|nr:hypothetical protein C5167_034341 [Papaver somniferum]